MAQANPNPIPDPLFCVARAVMVFARHNAIELVKAEIRRRGEKVCHYSAKMLIDRADEILRERPEMIEEARLRLTEITEALFCNDFSCAENRCEMIIGYCRVSTDSQSFDAQQAALKANGATSVFAEKVSGARSDRAQLAKAIAALAEGDVLLVTRPDRLARSTRDLLNVLAILSEKGAGFRSLADPMIDTTSAHGRLILAVLGALAEFERSMILARTSEGRKRAQERGIRFGRKPKLSQFQIAEASEAQS